MSHQTGISIALCFTIQNENAQINWIENINRNQRTEAGSENWIRMIVLDHGLGNSMLFGVHLFPKVPRKYELEIERKELMVDERHMVAKVHYFVSDYYNTEYCIDENCTHRH